MTSDWLTLDTWLISDLHFGHNNIIKYQNRPQDHDQIMLDNWIDNVADTDTVFHLGDWGFESALPTLKCLTGDTYTLIGNHDKKIKEHFSTLDIKIASDQYWEYQYTHEGKNKSVSNNWLIKEIEGKRICFSHYPDIDNPSKWDINIHGHTHQSPYHYSIRPNRDYRNICVENTNYAPQRLRDILSGSALYGTPNTLGITDKYPM